MSEQAQKKHKKTHKKKHTHHSPPIYHAVFKNLNKNPSSFFRPCRLRPLDLWSNGCRGGASGLPCATQKSLRGRSKEALRRSALGEKKTAIWGKIWGKIWTNMGKYEENMGNTWGKIWETYEQIWGTYGEHMNKHGEHMMGNMGKMYGQIWWKDGKQHVCSWWFSRDFSCFGHLQVLRWFFLEMWCVQTPSRLLIFWRLGRKWIKIWSGKTSAGSTLGGVDPDAP